LVVVAAAVDLREPLPMAPGSAGVAFAAEAPGAAGAGSFMLLGL
jgi:hypothetical protein